MCLYCLQYYEIEVHFCSWCWQSLSPPHPPPCIPAPSASALTGSLCQHLSPDNHWPLDYMWRPTALPWSQVWFPSWQTASHLMAEEQELTRIHINYSPIPHGSQPTTNTSIHSWISNVNPHLHIDMYNHACDWLKYVPEAQATKELFVLVLCKIQIF